MWRGPEKHPTSHLTKRGSLWNMALLPPRDPVLALLAEHRGSASQHASGDGLLASSTSLGSHQVRQAFDPRANFVAHVLRGHQVKASEHRTTEVSPMYQSSNTLSLAIP